MGSKFSFLERHHENSTGPESSAVAHSIEATETEGTQTPSGVDDNTYAAPLPSEIGPPGYEPLTYGGTGLTNSATSQTAFGMMPRYDFGGAPYGMDFMNNAYISHYDLPGASAHDPYDEDEVFMRQPGPMLYPNHFNPYVGNIGYPNNGGYLGNTAYPGMYSYGYPGSAALYAYPGAESACVEQGDTMRYVQCLENGVLAVWGDERNEYFPQQFSKEASIYCFTDVNDRSLVLANKMIANVLIQTSKADQKALEQEQLPEETHLYKPLNKIIQKLKRSKSSVNDNAIEQPNVDKPKENDNIESKIDENDKPSTSAENGLELNQQEEKRQIDVKNMEQGALSDTKPTDSERKPTDSESETNQQHQDEAIDEEKKE